MTKTNKISIIVPCYKTEKYLKRCLDSLLRQSYKNLEIIVVNDFSPDKTKDILTQYSKNDNRIKIVEHKKNKGLFQARLTGAKKATGDYIAFVDSDDYIDFDFYRELIETQKESNADMVVCNTVRESSDDKFIYNLFSTGKQEINKNELLDEYFKQRGYNYRWHTVWNKLYTMKLWKKAEKYYDDIKNHLIMTEDFAFSSILYYFADKLVYNERANYFYCMNNKASTSINKLTVQKCKKNISDIQTSFNFVESFLKQKNIYTKYKEDFHFWKVIYLKIWYDNASQANFNNNSKQEIIKLILDIERNYFNYDFKDKDNFYLVTTRFNPGLLKLKEKIINNDIISFDMFDTLIIRPFYEPKDMFLLLNKEFNKLFNFNGLIEFHKIREISERKVRNKILLEKNMEEITLDEIYEHMANLYKLDINKLNILKQKELDLELKFCEQRKTAYSIFKLCKQLNKKVIITTDIYLSRNTIENILNKNGYTDLDKIFISSEEKITKHTGNLFKLLTNEFADKSILHIGDNYHSDVVKPNEFGINSHYLPKTTDVFNNYSSDQNNVNNCGKLYEHFVNLNIDHSFTTCHMGNRISFAIIANKFFDNPFVSFNINSDFNCNPYFVGYYALGMHILALSSWLLNESTENQYDTIGFMARDGYLPYLACEKMLKTGKYGKVKINYVNVSRKSLIPLILNDFAFFHKIPEYIPVNLTTPLEIIDLLKPVLKDHINIEKILSKNNIIANKPIENIETFDCLINIINSDMYDINKFNRYKNIVKEYFEQNYLGKAVAFDIGYSGQPELIISDLIGKPIDTYFIHSNNDSSFKNSKYANNKLNTFYDFKPVFTGTLREYLISSDSPSCKMYKKEKNKTIPVFEDKVNYSYFNKKMLEEIQNGCLDFIDDFLNKFANFKELIELNNYYMSLSLEYFMHYSKDNDREIFHNLFFESNVAEVVEINKLWQQEVNNINYTYKDFLDERVNNRNIFIKVLYYITYDRVALRNKIGKCLNNDGIIYKGLRKFYRILKK